MLMILRHSDLIEVLHNLFEAIIDPFRYPTTGRRAKGKFDNPLPLIVHLPGFAWIATTGWGYTNPKVIALTSDPINPAFVALALIPA